MPPYQRKMSKKANSLQDLRVFCHPMAHVVINAILANATATKKKQT
jgi:hypothetical protein